MVYGLVCGCHAPALLPRAGATNIHAAATATSNLSAGWLPAAGEQRVKSVAVGLWSSCALLDDDSAWCWGESHVGSSSDEAQLPRQLPLAGVTKLLGAGQRFFALTKTFGLFFWGSQWFGDERIAASSPRALPLGPVADVASSYEDVCALEKSGRISCWGAQGRVSTPFVLQNARSLAISTDQRCALLTDGTVSCWQGDARPVRRAGLSDIAALVAGGALHCALGKQGDVSCWSSKGENAEARTTLGAGVSRLSATPHAICAFTDAALPRCLSVASGSDRDHAVMSPQRRFPRDLSVSGLAIGPEHACATINGVAWCWGDDSVFGQLGNANSLPDGEQLVRVSLGDTAALRRVRGVAVSDGRRCVVVDDGTLRCWGQSTSDDEVQNVEPAPSGFGPTAVSGVSGVASVAINDTTTCTTSVDGVLRCWGKMRLDAAGVSQFGIGEQHACWVTRGRGVRCWGDNETGQLGTGDRTLHAEAVPVLTSPGHELSNVKILRVFAAHTCAITASTELYCWGANSAFQQGRPYNSSAFVAFATPLASARTARDVSDACIVTVTGELRCWGDIFPDSRRFSYTPVAIGRCAVEQIASGPGGCFADREGWTCLGAGDDDTGRWTTQALRVPAKLSQVTGSRSELCGIDADGALACFKSASEGVKPSIGTIAATAAAFPPVRVECKVDAPPPLPKFPREPFVSVKAQRSKSPLQSDQLDPTDPGEQLSPTQISRLLALLNDPQSFTRRVTCHDPDYYYVFRDRAGVVQAQVGVGDCFTIESSPEIPAQHGQGNIMAEPLARGLLKLCKELHLAACAAPSAAGPEDEESN